LKVLESYFIASGFLNKSVMTRDFFPSSLFCGSIAFSRRDFGSSIFVVALVAYGFGTQL